MLPELRLLRLIEYRGKSSATTDQESISKFPDLPHGGIGGRDSCGVVSLAEFPPFRPGALKGVVAWRLRPGLDLAADYPTAYPLMVEGNQLVTMGERRFAAIGLDGRDALEIAARVANHPAIDALRLYLSTHGTLYLPLR